MVHKFLRKKKRLTFFTLIILAIILVGIIAGNTLLRSTLDTRSKAEERPFFGCVSGGEWLCACEVPGVGWQALECSILEDTEGKQKYIDRCGGDAEKAKIQWLWDMATRDGRVDPTCCGGQNVCGGLVKDPKSPPKSFPTPETIIWPTQPFVEIPTLIPLPTLIYQVPTQPIMTPTIIYLPPTQPAAPMVIYVSPTDIPYIPPTVIIKPTSIPEVAAKPIINIDIKKNIEGLMSFVENTKKALTIFFSQILP